MGSVGIVSVFETRKMTEGELWEDGGVFVVVGENQRESFVVGMVARVFLMYWADEEG